MVSTMSSTLSDGLDPRELFFRGAGRVTAVRLPGSSVGLVTGVAGTDSGRFSRIELLVVLLLIACVLERSKVND